MNPFLDACGATGPLLLSVDATGAPAGDARSTSRSSWSGSTPAVT